MKKKILLVLLVLLAGFSFVGCTKKEEPKKEEKKEEKKEDPKKAQEVKSKLVTDDKKIVFKQEPATYIVYNFEGEKITGFAEYIDYVYAEDAEKAIKGYDEDMKNKRYESVKTDGQYVVVTHNKAEYEYWTVSAVKQAHKNLKIVK